MSANEKIFNVPKVLRMLLEICSFDPFRVWHRQRNFGFLVKFGHFDSVTASWCLTSRATHLFVQQLLHVANSEERIAAKVKKQPWNMWPKRSSESIKNNWCNTLRWRQNRRDGVSIHQPHCCLLNRLLWRRSKEKPQSSASLAFVWGIHRRPVNSPHKWPVTRNMFPFNDVIMNNKTKRNKAVCIFYGTNASQVYRCKPIEHS